MNKQQVLDAIAHVYSELEESQEQAQKNFETGMKLANENTALREQIENLHNTPKPLAFSERDNVPCTAELEVKLQKLATYFTKRAKENKKRAEREEQFAERKRAWTNLSDAQEHDRSSYYFSGKADTYERAAAKLREALGETVPFGGASYTSVFFDEAKNLITPPEFTSGTWPALFGGKPEEQWIVERLFSGRDDSSRYRAVRNRSKYRAVRLEEPKPEQWIIEYASKKLGYQKIWHPSHDSGLREIFPSFAAAMKTINEEDPKPNHIIRRATKLNN